MRSKPRRFDVVVKGDDVRIDDDDFGWDASLIVYGDFGDVRLKAIFAQSVCDLLNAQPNMIAVCSPDNGDEGLS